MNQSELQREEWDFTGLPKAELLPALFWEARRERVEDDELIVQAQKWLDGKLSRKKPPMLKNSRAGKLFGRNTNQSEAEKARTMAMAVFQDFIPHTEFHFYWNKSRRDREADWERWHVEQLKPLVRNAHLPWLCLPVKERTRLADIFQRMQTANVVHIDSWGEAVSRYMKEKPDTGSPLKFEYQLEFQQKAHPVRNRKTVGSVRADSDQSHRAVRFPGEKEQGFLNQAGANRDDAFASSLYAL